MCRTTTPPSWVRRSGKRGDSGGLTAAPLPRGVEPVGRAKGSRTRRSVCDELAALRGLAPATSILRPPSAIDRCTVSSPSALRRKLGTRAMGVLGQLCQAWLRTSPIAADGAFCRRLRAGRLAAATRSAARPTRKSVAGSIFADTRMHSVSKCLDKLKSSTASLSCISWPSSGFNLQPPARTEEI